MYNKILLMRTNESQAEWVDLQIDLWDLMNYLKALDSRHLRLPVVAMLSMRRNFYGTFYIDAVQGKSEKEFWNNDVLKPYLPIFEKAINKLSNTKHIELSKKIVQAIKEGYIYLTSESDIVDDEWEDTLVQLLIDKWKDKNSRIQLVETGEYYESYTYDVIVKKH